MFKKPNKPVHETLVLTLDVAGKKKMYTTVETLTQGRSKDSKLAQMVENCLKHVQGTIHPIFIDRDPESFKWILHYLRGYEITVENDSPLIKKIMVDAEKLGLNELLDKLKRYTGGIEEETLFSSRPDLSSRSADEEGFSQRFNLVDLDPYAKDPKFVSFETPRSEDR